jgi:hypothetical protein
MSRHKRIDPQASFITQTIAKMPAATIPPHHGCCSRLTVPSTAAVEAATTMQAAASKSATPHASHTSGAEISATETAATDTAKSGRTKATSVTVSRMSRESVGASPVSRTTGPSTKHFRPTGWEPSH